VLASAKVIITFFITIVVEIEFMIVAISKMVISVINTLSFSGFAVDINCCFKVTNN